MSLVRESEKDAGFVAFWPSLLGLPKGNVFKVPVAFQKVFRPVKIPLKTL